MGFYAYLWMREDGTPYYAGKGCGNRAYTSRAHNIHCPKHRLRILIFHRDTEAEAFATEKELIRNWGRKDLGTGCLRNLTEGGEGRAGALVSEETRQKQSRAKIGKPSLRKGKKASLETRAKQSEAAKRRDPKTRRSWNSGRHLTIDQKMQKSIAMKNFWSINIRAPISEETRKKMSDAKLGTHFHLGFRHSEETKQKMRNAKRKKRENI